MISRRDQLLIRPWEQRKYENHCRKIRSALPAIDVGPPALHHHVTCKLKKRQRESERCDEIEKNNLRLLQSLRGIMTTSRVNNSWTTAQPNFLNRVKLFETSVSKFTDEFDEVLSMFDSKTRRGRCNACNPKLTKQISIPEERIPWEPMKPAVSKRSQSLPPQKVHIVDPIKDDELPKKAVSKTTTPKRTRKSRVHRHKIPPIDASRSIVLKRGDLQLALNFPSDTQIKLYDGQNEKFIIRNSCQCKAIKSI